METTASTSTRQKQEQKKVFDWLQNHQWMKHDPSSDPLAELKVAAISWSNGDEVAAYFKEREQQLVGVTADIMR